MLDLLRVLLCCAIECVTDRRIQWVWDTKNVVLQGAPERGRQQQPSQSIATQRPGGQENCAVSTKRPSSASKVPSDGACKKGEGVGEQARLAVNSVASRFSSKKRRT